MLLLGKTRARRKQQGDILKLLRLVFSHICGAKYLRPGPLRISDTNSFEFHEVPLAGIAFV
jgi:hypothetical protein